jgi:hypothetical protein
LPAAPLPHSLRCCFLLHPDAKEPKMRTTRFALAALAATLLAALSPRPLSAQSRLSIAPTIGVYIPTSELVRAANGDEFKQEVSVLVGGRVGYRFSQRLSLEVTGTYAPSNLRFDLATGEQTDADANVTTGSGRLNLWLLPGTSPVNFLLSGGVGVIHRGGDAYEDLEDRTAVGPTFGASVRLRVPGLGAFQVNAENYLYRQGFTDPLGDEDERTQNDIHLSVGFGFGAY